MVADGYWASTESWARALWSPIGTQRTTLAVGDAPLGVPLSLRLGCAGTRRVDLYGRRITVIPSVRN